VAFRSVSLPHTGSSGFGLAGIASSLLGAGLIKPSLDPTLPILPEMILV
jgi:LPXTG-motif cell wall-anchored protein